MTSALLTRNIPDTNDAGQELQSAQPGPASSSGDLARAAASGRADAWEALVDRHTGRLWALARTFRLRDADAADVIQTTWLRLAESIGSLRDPECIAGWLATTARRECLHRLRSREQPSDAVHVVDRPDPGPGPEQTVIRRTERDLLLGALRRLPDRDQQLLRLLMDSPSPGYSEIAAALHMPIGSIGPTRSRALGRLRRELAAVGLTDSAEH
jgi:RNA polymerase sigma factor (sigma-70 family)